MLQFQQEVELEATPTARLSARMPFPHTFPHFSVGSSADTILVCSTYLPHLLLDNKVRICDSHLSPDTSGNI